MEVYIKWNRILIRYSGLRQGAICFDELSVTQNYFWFPGGLFEEHICGRPLGLRFDAKGSLYVSDAYFGIFKVNMSTGIVYQIFFSLS